MTIELSHHDLSLLCGEVTQASGVVQSLWHISQSTWLFQTRGSGENHMFVVSCDPRWARLHLVERKEDDARTPDALTMLMRKWLIPSHFLGASLDQDDRIVTLTFKNASIEFQLFLEVSERWANLSLVRDGVVLGCHVTNSRVRIHKEWQLPETVRISPLANLLPAGEPSRHLAQEVTQHIQLATDAEALGQATSAVEDALRRMRRREKAVSRDLAKIENSELLRRKGELLKTLHGQIPPGATKVRVVDYWDPNLGEVEVELDPTRSLQANIDRAFHEYRRLKNAQVKVEARLLETMEYIDQLEAMVAHLADASMSPQAVLAKLKRLRLYVDKKVARSKGPELRKPYRLFQTSRGVQILVGRSAKDNDAVTLKHARGRDVWLHARDVAGSHVILRVEKNAAVDGQDLLEAALLAAWFSKAKEDTVIDVMWTEAKHVRKPKGAAPGSVSVAGGANIAVSRDEAKLQKLLDGEIQENEKPA